MHVPIYKRHEHFYYSIKKKNHILPAYCVLNILGFAQEFSIISHIVFRRYRRVVNILYRITNTNVARVINILAELRGSINP